MSKTKREECERTIEHPLEGALDIENGTTVVPYVERSTELAQVESYDEKDSEIESQYQEIYDAAMEAFDQTAGRIEQIEGKYRARNEEVAVQYLNAALNATRGKADVKQHKDKMSIAQGKLKGNSNVTNNNLIVADHKELIDLIETRRQQQDDVD